MSDISIDQINAPEAQELEGHLQSLIKGLEGRADLTEDIIAEHILQNSPDLIDDTESEGAGLLPFPIKRSVKVQFLDNNLVEITDIGGFIPFFTGKSVPQWQGTSAGYLVTRAFPPTKIAAFTGVNSWVWTSLRLPVKGHLVLAFYWMNPRGFKKFGVYVGSHIPPTKPGKIVVERCKGVGRFGLLRK